MISVIVPVYNVEKYLCKCLDSLLVDIGDNEIILVDDGSTDHSGKICDEYASNSRIKVIHQKNGGLSAARNSGIDNVAGDWITFVDSDDWVEPNYFTHISENLSQENGLLIFSYWIDSPVYQTSKSVSVVSRKKMDVSNTIRELDLHGMFNVVWNKVYKASIINDSQCPIRFQLSADPGEDLLFNCEYFEKIHFATLSDQCLYHWMRYGENSLANRYRDNLFQKNKQFIQRKCQLYEFEKMHFPEDNLMLAQCYLDYIFACVPNMYRIESTISKKQRLEFYREILNNDEYKKQILFAAPEGKLQKQFVKLYKTNNYRLMDCAYYMMLFVRNKFQKIYARTQKHL